MHTRYITSIRLLFTFTFLFVANQAVAACYWWQDCTQYKTKYPIMLVHGVAGFDSLLGVDYFYRVPQVLSERGATVFIANVSAANTPAFRGEQLISQIENTLAISGASKVNIIGHSLGAPTARYVAGVRPDLVASVTTISGVNTGTELADWVLEQVNAVDAEPVFNSVLNAFAGLIDVLSGAPAGTQEDAIASAQSMTVASMAEFNSTFSDGMPSSSCGQGDELVNGIYYYSWGGNAEVTNTLDPSDAFIGVTGLVFGSTPNDGLVPSCRMRWGKVISTNYKMNHADTINHLFGLHHLFEIDPLTLYKNHAIRLKSKGL